MQNVIISPSMTTSYFVPAATPTTTPTASEGTDHNYIISGETFMCGEKVPLYQVVLYARCNIALKDVQCDILDWMQDNILCSDKLPLKQVQT